MHDGQPVRDGPRHLAHVDLDAARVAAAGAEQVLDQGAVAAADVEHARARLDHLRHQLEVEAHVLGEILDRPLQGSPACSAQPARKPDRVRWKSGSSSRKASWPLSLLISTKLALAPARFSARAMARDCAVGNSQSLSNETT